MTVQGRTILKRAARWTAAATLAVVLLTVGWLALPVPAVLLARQPAPSVTLEDRFGAVLRTTRAGDGTRARWMPFAEIDADLIRAFVAVEDRRFYEHGGVDVAAAGRAARDNLRAGHVVSGASTLSMQAARLIRGTPRTWAGKVGQALWAVRLEWHLDKEQILEQYLNRVHLGQGAVGVSSAAALYFGASAADVSVGQAALLAGIAHAPSSDNPLVSARRARARRAVALGRMRAAGYVTAADVERAGAEPLVTRGGGTPFLAPHFTTRMLSWLGGGPAPVGVSGGERGEGVSAGVVRTSLDLALQRALEEEVRHTVDELHDRGAGQAAAVVLDNASGEVLAWVGSPDFWASTEGQTDMVVSARQPGSALKPFVYGLAFDRGHTAATVLADVARVYATVTGPYRPRNYDHRFHGPVRAREALASSYNIPAVAVAERLGVGSVLETLHRAGFASLSRRADHYGLGLALGNGDVTLLELANGYRALANRGVWRPAAWTAGLDARHSAAGPGAAESRVMSPRAAALVLDILADPAARVPGFGVSTPFDFPFRAAVKTGTSRHFTDNWAVAVTGRFTVAVWVGNFNGRPMEGVSGVTGAGPLLHRAVMVTAARYAPGDLVRPEDAGLVPARICRLSGELAGPDCPHTVEWFLPGSAPTAQCDWHRGGRVTLPAEYAEWERVGDGVSVADAAPLAGGAGDAGRIARGPAPHEVSGAPPERQSGAAGADDRNQNRAMGSNSPRGAAPDSAAGESRFRIVSPRDGDRYRVPPGVAARYATVGLRAVGARDAGALRWFLDGRRVEAARLPLVPGEHVIRAQAASGEVDEVRIVVR